MSETETPETPETPEVPAVDLFLEHTKRVTLDRMISHMNGVGAAIINRYPMAEVQSWTLQKAEAEALLANATTELSDVRLLAPFILKVTEVHYGPVEDDAERVAQAIRKAHTVVANANLWSALSAFVNGLRARAEDRIEAADTLEAVFTIESETQSELSIFRDQYGV